MSTSTATRSTFSQLAENATTLGLSKTPLRYARFGGLVTMLGAEIHWMGVSVEDASQAEKNKQVLAVEDAAQAEKNKQVLAGLTKLGFPMFLENTLVPLMNFDDTDFAKFTLLKTVKSWLGDEDDQTAQTETEEETPYRPRRGVRGIPLGTIYFSEKLRALRFTLDEMRHRVWRTYDATETKTVERTVKGKQVKQTFKVCNPERATYRVGDRVRTSLEYTEFCTLLLDAYTYLEKFDQDLTQFSSIFRTASSVAYQIRTEAKQKAFAEKKKTLAEVKPAAKPTPKAPVKTAPPPAENAWALRKKQAQQAEPAQAEVAEAQPVVAEDAEAESEVAEDAPAEPEVGEDAEGDEWKTVPLNKKGQLVEAPPRQRGRGRRFKQN